MSKKTKSDIAPEPDFKHLWQNLKGFVKRQIKIPKWDDKTANEVWEFLDTSLDFWEVCYVKPPTSWDDDELR